MGCFSLIWHSLYIRLQLCDLQPEGNTLFVFHTLIRFIWLQMCLEFVLFLLQVYNPCLFCLIIFNVHIDAAFADVGVESLDLLTQFLFVLHRLVLLCLEAFGRIGYPHARMALFSILN
jgi:hypothetical protein